MGYEAVQNPDDISSERSYEWLKIWNNIIMKNN